MKEVVEVVSVVLPALALVGIGVLAALLIPQEGEAAGSDRVKTLRKVGVSILAAFAVMGIILLLL